MCRKTHTSSRSNKISQTKLSRTQFLRCKSFPARNYYLSNHPCCNKDRLQSCDKYKYQYQYQSNKHHSNIIHMFTSMTLLVQINSEYYIHLLEWPSLIAGKDIDCKWDTVSLISKCHGSALFCLCRKLHPLVQKHDRNIR